MAYNYHYFTNMSLEDRIEANENSINEILKAVQQIKDRLDIKDHSIASLGVLNPSFKEGEGIGAGNSNEG